MISRFIGEWLRSIVDVVVTIAGMMPPSGGDSQWLIPRSFRASANYFVVGWTCFKADVYFIRHKRCSKAG
jgi:hypothetical protein